MRSLLISFFLYFFALFMVEISLTARSQVFTPDPLTPIREDGNWRTDRSPQLRLVAPRNGTATAPLVVTNPGSGLSAQIGDLTHERGRATFPASQLIVRYGWKGLEPSPQTSSSAQAVWLTAEVPPGTLPGNYRGELRLRGMPNIPVLLEVGEWLAPRPNDFVAWQSYLHSPETIARHYNVEIWSEEHFSLMEPSLRLLGQLGSHVMYLPVVGRTHFGNHYGLIRWSGSGANAQPEFQALERYFELWHKHVGPPRVIIVYMHETGWWRDLGADDTLTVTEAPSRGIGGGRLVEWPQIWRPGQAEIWRRAFDGLQERVKRQNWEGSEVLIGMVGDTRNFPEDVLRFYRQAAPEIRWATFTHGRGDPRRPDRREEPYRLGEVNYGYVEKPYPFWDGGGIQLPENPLNQNPPWRNTFPFITSHRHTTNHNVERTHPAFWHFKVTASIFNTKANYIGFGRKGLDFWDIDGRSLLGRYERWHNLMRDNVRWMTYPGPEGALSTQSVELARAGNAATEALRMMHDAIGSGKLSSSLRAEAEEAFLGYYQLSRSFLDSRVAGSLEASLDRASTAPWQDALRKLFDVAGRVAEAADMVAEIDMDAAAVALYREDRARTWTSSDGRTLRAVFMSYQPGQVTLLLPGNEVVTVPLERLSKADEEWIREETGMRIWRNRQGSEIEARLLDYSNGMVRLERADGNIFNLSSATLSDEDQKFLGTGNE